MEIIDESVGRLVPPGDPAVLADTLRGLLFDSLSRENMGRNGPRRARQFSDPVGVLDQLRNSLSELCVP